MSVDIFRVNGIKVANIHNDSQLALFGIGVLAGSNYERPEIAGISHFGEHMFFKGTTSRDWKQLMRDFAKLGVNNNAYTNNTEVFYHTTCPVYNVENVVEIMMDMLFNSTLPEEELEKERQVIMEEKKMYDDDHAFAFESAITNGFYEWQRGHDIIGSFETISSISRSDIVDYTRSLYNPDTMILICCGDVDTDDLRTCLEKHIPTSHPYLDGTGKHDIGGGDFFTDLIKKDSKIKLDVERENTTQAQIRMVGRSLSSFDNLYPHAAVLCNAVGGGMHSMLFARIREELGLCYSVGMYQYAIEYPHDITLQLYGYTSPKNIDTFIEESEKVLQDVIKNGIDEELFECAKTDVIAAILHKTETSYGKAACLLKRFLMGKTDSVDSMVERLKGVDIATCNELAGSLLDFDYNWAIMRPKA